MDTPQRHDALVVSQDELVAAARDHDFVEFTNRLTVWLINHTTSDEVTEQVKKTSCTWNTNTDGSIDGRFHLDPLSAAAVGTALGDEMQRLFGQQSEGNGHAETPNRRRGQALVGLVVGGAEAPGSATTTPLVNLVIGQKILENFLDRFLDPDTVWPCFASPTRVCRPANSPTRRWIRRCLPKANSGLPGNARQHIDMSVKARGFPDWMKRALLIEARGRCRTRGCDAPYHWLQVDHIHPHSKGGPTSLANGQILRCLPQANSGLPGNARQYCDPDNKWKRDLVQAVA